MVVGIERHTINKAVDNVSKSNIITPNIIIMNGVINDNNIAIADIIKFIISFIFLIFLLVYYFYIIIQLQILRYILSAYEVYTLQDYPILFLTYHESFVYHLHMFFVEHQYLEENQVTKLE